MTPFLLDTNAVSHLIRGHDAVLRRVIATPMAALAISAVTEGEMLYGLAKRPEARRLSIAVHEFLQRVDVLPWDRQAAARYGEIRAHMDRLGHGMAPLDQMIAAHALGLGATLVTSDHAFTRVPGLAIEDWTG